MKNKNDVINEVIISMQEYLDSKEMDMLKNVLIVKMHDFEIVSSNTLPSTEVCDNQWAIKRFSIDMMAAGKRKSTIEQYMRTVKNFFDKSGLNYSNTTGQDITDYLAIMQYEKKISNSYKATIRKYLKAFFDWAYRKHHIDVDVMRDVDKVAFKQKKKDRLTDEEVEKCRYVVKHDTRKAALLELMLNTGMRVGEIAKLNISDLDFDQNTIRIYAEKTDTVRQGVITARLKIALRAYLGDRKEGALFIGKRGKGRMCNASIEALSKEIAFEAGCHCKSTVHVYRKTFASVLYRKTSDILLVSKMLGHANTDVTIKYYLVDDIEDMKYRVQRAA